jgi:hypothetical protein
MPRPIPTVEHAMEAQAAIRRVQHATAPLWESAIRLGNWGLLSECKRLDATLRLAMGQARRIAGLAETACPDEQTGSPHGRAA